MYLQISDLQIYYQKVGTGKNLLMLHGWKQDLSTFYPTLENLKKDFTIWLIDLPGFGRSDLPKKAFTVSDYAAMVSSFIKHFKIQKPILFGHSFGGRVAIKLAAKNPGLIDKLILENSAGIQPKQNPLNDLIYLVAKILKYAIPDIFHLKLKLRSKYYKFLESDYLNAGELAETLTNILKEDLTEDLPKIKTETLLIWGEKDPNKESSLSNGKKMYRLIPNSKMEIFDEVGHFPHLENPERFTHYVKDFSSI